MKFVDDLTLAETINVRDCVLPNPDPNPPRPLSYHDRTLHVLPHDQTPVQGELYKMVQYCENKRLIIPNIHMKFVYDLTLAETINVRDCVLPNPDPNPPRPYPTMIGLSMC